MKETIHSRAVTAAVILGIVFATQFVHYLRSSSSPRILSRQKRLLFMTPDRKLSLPPSTTLAVTFTLNLPLTTNLPTGYSINNMLVSFPCSISFDKLGLTSPLNPFGMWPFRKKRDLSPSPTPPIDITDGDRSTLYKIVEGSLYNVGLQGSPCLQRAICEFFQGPLTNHGFFGEILELFFSASYSSDSLGNLRDYVEAEMAGKTTGNCTAYQAQCSTSLFTENLLEQDLSDEHSREKRFIYITPERRLRFPAGTLFFVTFSLSLPSGRLLPTNYGSGLSLSIPVAMNLDDLGLTIEDHPFGNFTILTEIFRRRREAGDEAPGINWAGGDREIMYRVVENTLANVGMNGKACMLRAICEMFQSPLDRHGILGEALELFFSPSKSPYADVRLEDYVEAELVGRSTGVCVDYHKFCPHSFFKDTLVSTLQPRDVVDSLMTMIGHRTTT